MRSFFAVAVLFVASTVSASETDPCIHGRGLTHFHPRECEPIAEVVCLSCRTVAVLPPPKSSTAPAPVVSATETEKAWASQFSAAHEPVTVAPKIKDVGVDNEALEVKVDILNPEIVKLVDKLTQENLIRPEFSAAKELSKIAPPMPTPTATSSPTPEQLEMMREFHLSTPPTILASDSSVRAAGQTSRGEAVSSPTIYYSQNYCPECQLRKNRHY